MLVQKPTKHAIFGPSLFLGNLRIATLFRQKKTQKDLKNGKIGAKAR